MNRPLFFTGHYSCSDSNGVEKWYSTQQDCQSDGSCEDGSACDPSGDACSDGSNCVAFCAIVCSLDEPYALESLSNQRDIFDRWGNRVYDGQNILLNEYNEGWDGIYKDQPVNPGVFTWLAKVRFIDD